MFFCKFGIHVFSHLFMFMICRLVLLAVFRLVRSQFATIFFFFIYLERAFWRLFKEEKNLIRH